MSIIDESFLSEEDVILAERSDGNDEHNNEFDGEEEDDDGEDEDEDDGDNGDDESHNDDDDDDDEGDNAHNDLIINTLSDFVTSNGNTEEDLPSYKAKMKILLEQLMLKLEEDVDYQKNLEGQIDELEKELNLKDQLIEQISLQTKESIDDVKSQTEDLADEMVSKINSEKQKRTALEKIVLRLQNDNAKLQSDLRISKLAQINPNIHLRNTTTNDKDESSSPTVRKDINSSKQISSSSSSSSSSQDENKEISLLKTEVSVLNKKLLESCQEMERIKHQREIEMKTMLNLANTFQMKLDILMNEKLISNNNTNSSNGMGKSV